MVASITQVPSYLDKPLAYQAVLSAPAAVLCFIFIYLLSLAVLLICFLTCLVYTLFTFYRIALCCILLCLLLATLAPLCRM